jgi:hypothetical protein
VQLPHESLVPLQRLRLAAGGGRGAQQGLQHVLGQQIVLELALQQHCRIGRAAFGQPLFGLALRGFAPGRIQRPTLRMQPLVHPRHARQRCRLHQGPAPQGQRAAPLAGATGRAEVLHVAAQRQPHAALL